MAQETAELEAEAPREEAEPETTEPAAEAGGGRRNLTSVIGGGLVVAAAAGACWFGWSWYTAGHDESLKYSELREQVLQNGSQAVQNLNTLDYRDADKGLALWQGSTTNELYQQIVQGREKFAGDIRAAKTVSTARILEAAITDLDDHAGKARMLVAVELTVTPEQGPPAVKKRRLVAQLTRTASGWKLSALDQAPVRAS